MPANSSTGTKVCTRCHRDCSGKPRTKDARGRYTCKTCVDAAAAAPAANAEPEPEPLGYSLADDLPAQPAEPVAGGPCPGCGNFVPSRTVVCTGCGYNTRTKRQAEVRTQVEVVDHETPRDKRKREFARQSRAEYAKAAAVMAGGLALGSLLVADKYGAQGVLGYALIVGVYSVVAAIVYVGCCLSWVGFDASLPLSIVRIVAVCTIVAGVQVLTAGLPMFYGRMILLTLVYAGVLTRLADIEFDDAVLIGLITGALWLGLQLTLIMTILSH